MPRVTIKTGFVARSGQEEILAEYICDWPDCSNVAEHVVGVVRDLGLTTALCGKHAELLRKRASASDSN
jgi:hypothetical protein